MPCSPRQASPRKKVGTKRSLLHRRKRAPRRLFIDAALCNASTAREDLTLVHIDKDLKLTEALLRQLSTNTYDEPLSNSSDKP